MPVGQHDPDIDDQRKRVGRQDFGARSGILVLDLGLDSGLRLASGFDLFVRLRFLFPGLLRRGGLPGQAGKERQSRRNGARVSAGKPIHPSSFHCREACFR